MGRAVGAGVFGGFVRFARVGAAEGRDSGRALGRPTGIFSGFLRLVRVGATEGRDDGRALGRLVGVPVGWLVSPADVGAGVAVGSGVVGDAVGGNSAVPVGLRVLRIFAKPSVG